MERIEKAQEGEAEKGMGTGVPKLDELTGGMRRGHYWVIGARTSVGKTSALITFSREPLQQGKRVVFVSLEMDAGRIVQRYSSQISELSIGKMETKGGLRTRGEMTKLTVSVEELMGKRLHVIEPPSRSVHDIVRAVEREHKRQPIDLLVVDYLQKLKDPSTGKNMSRQAELQNVSAEFQSMAKNLDCCVLTAAQLNRGSDGEGVRPKLSGFRECGDIEQDVDVAVLLHRGERDEHEHDPNEPAELIVAKNRDGMTGTVDCIFRKPIMAWEGK